MKWSPKDWIDYHASVQAFFSSKGCKVKKLIFPEGKEDDFFVAAIDNPDKYPEINGLRNTLCGAQMMFTPKLKENVLFLLEPDNA